jgi:PmbA protein
MKGKLIDTAKNAAQIAKQAGAKDSRAYVLRSREVRVEWRDGKLDRIRESTRKGLYVTLFVDGRYSSNSTSDLRDEALSRYVEQAVDTTRYLAPDEHRSLPDPSRYEGGPSQDLQLMDSAIGQVTPNQRLQLAQQLEEAARAVDSKGQIVSVSTSVSDYETEVAGVATNGLEAAEHTTRFSRSAEVTVAGADDRRPNGYSYASARHVSDLPSVETFGPDALQRAVGQLGSRQIRTGRYKVVIDNRTAPRLAWQLFGPLSGRNIQQKRSYLESKLNAEVGSKLLHVNDDPHLPRAVGSSHWDDEGMATTPRAVFDQGVLKSFYLNTYYASKLGVEPTSGSFFNLVWGHGKRGAAAIIADLDEGIYVTSFLGGNSNGTTGDFSVGIKGYYVKNGAIAHSISEMNMAGNHLELWKRLVEVGNDPWEYSSNRTPTLCFDDVQCSGSKG